MSARERYLAFRRTLSPRVPLERLTVSARGLEFAVWRTPAVDGRAPLLCINGGLLFGHELLWPALAPLAQRWQLYFYDQRGRGASSAAPGVGASRIEFDANDVPALRVALSLPEWNVLGHSWGGGIAMLAAAADREAVRQLVLVNAVGVTGEWLPPLHARALERLTGIARERLAAFDTRSLQEPDVALHANYAQSFFPAWFADTDFASVVAPPRGSSQTGAVVAARLRRDGYDWRQTVRDVSARTLVVHGAADVLPLAEAERTSLALPHARLVAIPNAGHNPFWEAPSEFFAVVDAFLEEGAPLT